MSLTALMAAAAMSQIPSPSTQFGPVVKWTTVAQGFNSRLDKPEWRSIISEAEWRRQFRRMFGLTADETVEYPRVADWNKEFVVLIAAGQKPTPGHSIYVETISRKQTAFWDIEVVEQKPPQGAILPQVLTNPWVLIRVDRTVGSPRLRTRTTTTSATVIPGQNWTGPRHGDVPVWRVGPGGRLIPVNDAAKQQSGDGRQGQG